MNLRNALYTALWMLPFFLTANIDADEILVNTQDGEAFVLEVDPTDSFGTLQEKIAALTNGKKSHLFIEYPNKGKFHHLNLNARSQGGDLGYPRNYLAEVSPEEKMAIRFIVNTLANKSLIAIALAKSDLELAGDRIDHIHPLRFLMTVFTDEELKVGIRNIRGKGWVWNHFLGGLKEALSVEMQHGNMKDEYLHNFSQTVKIDTRIILPAISQLRWDDFIDLLITHIPRSGDHDRYDT